MSKIKATLCNECVYDSLPIVPPSSPSNLTKAKPVSVIIISKLDTKKKDKKKDKKPKVKPYSSMGIPEVKLRKPEEFLKKGEGVRAPIKPKDHKCINYGRKTLDTRGRCNCLIKPEANYRVINILNVIKSKPKEIFPRLVDSRFGNIKNLKGSGEVPEYCLRKDFGVVPSYLKRARKAEEKKQAAIDLKESEWKDPCTLISEEERAELLENLKTIYIKLCQEYVLLPVIADTPSRIRRKEKAERDIKLMEKHIDLIESNRFIYVFDEELCEEEIISKI